MGSHTQRKVLCTTIVHRIPRRKVRRHNNQNGNQHRRFLKLIEIFWRSPVSVILRHYLAPLFIESIRLGGARGGLVIKISAG